MASITKSTESSSLAEVVDRILEKGVVIDAFAKVSLVGIELVTVEARVVIASIETYLKYAEAIGLTQTSAAPYLSGAADALSGAADTLTGAAGALGGATGALGGATGALGGATGAVGGVLGGATGAVGGATGIADSVTGAV